ncbi:MAG: hypothetical protein HQM04_09420 [Magnetococcales bacterium]|nr:hypothetical protein [Magnetococcales bacterium]MBF0115252.1 hypothetical protein [Magnetococcales bacterium]
MSLKDNTESSARSFESSLYKTGVQLLYSNQPADAALLLRRVVNTPDIDPMCHLFYGRALRQINNLNYARNKYNNLSQLYKDCRIAGNKPATKSSPIIMTDLIALQQKTPFLIFGDDKYANDIERLLIKFKRVDNYAGRITRNSFSQYKEEMFHNRYVIVAGSLWADDVDFLVANGVQYENIIIFIMPVGNVWGYHNVFINDLDLLRVSDDGNSWEISLSDFHALFLRRKEAMSGLSPLNANQQGNDSVSITIYKKDIVNKSISDQFVNDQVVYATRVFDRDGFYSSYHDAMKSNQNNSRIIEDRFSNKTSKNLYTSLFRYQYHEMIMYYANICFRKFQYSDYVDIRDGDVIINCGVENGFEIPFFAAMVGRTGQIHCIDPFGFQYLDDYVKPTVKYFDEVVINHEVALMDYTGQVTWKIAGEDRSFPCVTFEHFVESMGLDRVDLIKLDLEGTESVLLRSLLQMCKSFQCQLAISIYHSMQQYFDIPMFFMNNLADYSFYLDHYSFGRYETILYVIPESRKRQIKGK